MIRKAEELGLKLIADEENMTSQANILEPDISQVVKELNKIDKEKQYQVSDFIPKPS